MGFKKIALFILLLLIIVELKAIVRPETPQVRLISISLDNDFIIMEWVPYNIIKNPISEFQVFENLTADFFILNNELRFPKESHRCTFRYDIAKTRSVKFQLYAVEITNQGNNLSPDPINYPRTIFISANYDTCNNNIILHWNNYVGWDNFQYTVLRLKNNIPEPISPKLSSQDTVFEIRNVEQNTEYTFVVQAQNTDDTSLISYSNKTTIKTIFEKPSSYVIATNSEFSKPQHFLMNFEIDTTSNIKNYRLMKSNSKEGEYSLLKLFENYTNNILEYTDVLTNQQPAYYQLQNIGICKTTLRESNIVSTMFLEGEFVNEAKLKWNEFFDWPQKVQQYNVYRAIGNEPYQKVVAVSSSTFDYSDNVTELLGQQKAGNICYIVEAESYPSITEKQYSNKSSQKCFDLTSLNFVPNAFTPNGDNLNDEFKPTFAFAPNNYQLLVYNKSGAKVFETNDYTKGWNGTVAFGQKTDPGVYVYFMSYKTNSGQKIEKKGTISVIYP